MPPVRKDPIQPRGQSGLLDRASRLLWGDYYGQALADACGVNRKQVRRWLDGEVNIPEYAWNKVRSEVVVRLHQLNTFKEAHL